MDTLTIPLEQLRTGMHVEAVLGQHNGGTFPHKGLVTSDAIIQAMAQHGVQRLTVRSSCPLQNNFYEEDLSLSLSSQQIANSLANGKQDLQQLAWSIAKQHHFHFATLADSIDALTQCTYQDPTSLNWILSHHYQGDTHLECSIRVGVLMGLYTQALGFERSLVKDMIMAGLLHNLIDLTQPQHPYCHASSIQQGLTLIAQSQDHISIYCQRALQHFAERQDGNGYPHGLKGDDISLWGKLLAIVVAYDQLRYGTRPQHHFTVIQHIKNQTDTHYDLGLVLQFEELAHLFA